MKLFYWAGLIDFHWLLFGLAGSVIAALGLYLLVEICRRVGR